MHKKSLQDYLKGLKNIRLKIYDGAFYSSWLIRSYKIRIYTIYRMIYTIYRIEKAFLKSMSSRLRDGQVPLESSVFRGRDAFASRYFLYIRNGEMANSKQRIIHLQRKFSGRSFPAGRTPTSEQKTYSPCGTQPYSTTWAIYLSVHCRNILLFRCRQLRYTRMVDHGLPLQDFVPVYWQPALVWK